MKGVRIKIRIKWVRKVKNEGRKNKDKNEGSEKKDKNEGSQNKDKNTGLRI